MGFARNLILFLFEREHEGYKRFADCTVGISLLEIKRYINYSHKTNLMNVSILSENLAHRELAICFSFNCINFRNNVVTQPDPKLELPS